MRTPAIIITAIALILSLSIAPFVQAASTDQYYFAIASNDHLEKFFVSKIFVRNINTYKTQMDDTKAWKDILFDEPGLHSGGIIRARTEADALKMIERYKKTYEEKGYSINEVNWTP